MCFRERKDRVKMKKVAVLWSGPNTDGLTASTKNGDYPWFDRGGYSGKWDD